MEKIKERGRKANGVIVYHEFNDGEDEGRPPTPGPVGVWLEEGYESAREWEAFVEKGGDGGVGERDGGSGTVDGEGTWTWASSHPTEADSDADDTSREGDIHSESEGDMQLASENGPSKLSKPESKCRTC